MRDLYWRLYQHLWQNLKHRPATKVLAGALIGAIAMLMAVSLGQNDVDLPRNELVLWMSVGACIGAGSVGLLLYRDWKRSKNAKWKRSIDRLANDLRTQTGDRDDIDYQAIAREQLEQEPGGRLFWIGMVLGLIVILCGVAMYIVRVVEFVREFLG